MSLQIELGRASTSTCACCGRASHTLRGFVRANSTPCGAYFAGYTEGHGEGSLLVSLGDWSDRSTPAARRAMLLAVRDVGGRLQMMIRDAADCPWRDVAVAGRILNRREALTDPRKADFFHVADHVVEVDARFVSHFYPPLAST